MMINGKNKKLNVKVYIDLLCPNITFTKRPIVPPDLLWDKRCPCYYGLQLSIKTLHTQCF